MLVVYSLLVCLLIGTAIKAGATARALGIPVVAACGVLLAGVLYVSCLVPGLVGLLYTPVVYGLGVLLCTALMVLLGRLVPGAASRERADDQQVVVTLTASDLVLIGIGLLALTPLLDYLRWRFPAWLTDPTSVLGWDTVTYHLPAFIEFWQKHTLWALDGPYQSYSFAYELIGNYLSHPFHAHWGLVLAHAFALVLLLSSLAALAGELTPWLPACLNRRAHSGVATAMLASGIWSSVHTDSIGDVGKNDVFMTACLMASLGFFLRILAGRAGTRVQRRALVFLGSVALGLAVATKPSALAFVPFFALLAAVAWACEVGGLRSSRGAAVGAGFVLLMTLALGGFWLLRNLAVFGALSPLTGAWKTSLIANLANPALYQVKWGSALFGLGVLAAVPGAYLVYGARRDSPARLVLAALVAFHLVACVAFATTPFAIFHHDLSTTVWKLRLGMPLFTSAALIYSLAAMRLGDLVRGLRTRQRVALSVMLVLALMLALPLWWRARPAASLSGYDRVKGLPRTAVYRWVRGQPGPMRIYSAGLRPYGLYGPTWQNTLFYDLHSTLLSPLESGMIRLAAVVVQYQPDLVIISVDPHPYSGAVSKPPVVEWIKGLPVGCFEEVFSDDTVSAFRVQPGAATRLRLLIPPGYDLHMGG